MLKNFKNKLSHKESLTKEEYLYLYEHSDLLTLGQLANDVTHQLTGNDVSFVKNLHIDHTNLCVNQCAFCAYHRKKGEDGAFEHSIDDVLGLIEKHYQNIDQVHIVGGNHPDLDYSYYLNLIKNIRQTYPKLHIKAFTAIEINYFAKKFNKSVSEVLEDFKSCGLNSLPGGGAEILVDDVRKKICPQKGLSADWLNTHELAHNMGINTTATMLFGHVESVSDRIEHLIKLRDLQNKTKGFTHFVPLPFLPTNTKFSHIKPVTAVEILKTIAISRLVLNNIKRIKAYWVMMGLPLAQIALNFGANDLHGTVIQENISHMAGSKTPQGIGEGELKGLVKGAGKFFDKR